MNGTLRLRFDWPGLCQGTLANALGSSDGISEGDDGLCLTRELGGGRQTLEVQVCRGDLPTACPSEVLRLRELTDLRHLLKLPPDGGIQNLLRAPDASSVLAALDDRLARFRDRLKQERRVYVFAAHRNAAKCLRYCQNLNIEVLAFVDNDVSKQGGEFRGRPVLPLAAIRSEAIIINASGRYCVQINEQLRRQGYEWAIDMMEFLFLYDLPFQAEGRFRSYVSELVDNRLNVLALFLQLADEQSRGVLDGLIQFRLHLDSSIAGRQTSPYSEEFFAGDLLCLGPGEVFVDGGAYDGDSCLRFAAVAPNFHKAYLFEPDREICQRAERTVGQDPRVMICNFGLWSSTKELRFATTGGMDGAISTAGQVSVPVVSIDQYLRECITLIKLDVEGAEQEALLGASRAIGASRPKMAVAVYHRAGDLWHIPALIESLGRGYRFGIRHYSQTIDDTIVYALPNY